MNGRFVVATATPGNLHTTWWLMLTGWCLSHTIEKYEKNMRPSNWIISRDRGKNKKYLKPPPSLQLVILTNYILPIQDVIPKSLKVGHWLSQLKVLQKFFILPMVQKSG